MARTKRALPVMIERLGGVRAEVYCHSAGRGDGSRRRSSRGQREHKSCNPTRRFVCSQLSGTCLQYAKYVRQVTKRFNCTWKVCSKELRPKATDSSPPAPTSSSVAHHTLADRVREQLMRHGATLDRTDFYEDLWLCSQAGPRTIRTARADSHTARRPSTRAVRTQDAQVKRRKQTYRTGTHTDTQAHRMPAALISGATCAGKAAASGRAGLRQS